MSHSLDEFLAWFQSKTWYPHGVVLERTVYPTFTIVVGSIYKLFQKCHISMDLLDYSLMVNMMLLVLVILSFYSFVRFIMKMDQRHTEIQVEWTSLLACLMYVLVPCVLRENVYGNYTDFFFITFLEIQSLKSMFCASSSMIQNVLRISLSLLLLAATTSMAPLFFILYALYTVYQTTDSEKEEREKHMILNQYIFVYALFLILLYFTSFSYFNPLCLVYYHYLPIRR